MVFFFDELQRWREFTDWTVKKKKNLSRRRKTQSGVEIWRLETFRAR